MKPRLICAGFKTLFFIVCLPFCASAQVTAPPAAALPPYVSPEIRPDHTVTLRLRAPNALQVNLDLEGAVTPMQKDEDGLWSVTTSVLSPEIYAYRFVVDGQPMLDPRN